MIDKRIIVKNYNSDNDIHKIDGATGTIKEKRYNFWYVELDESIENIRYWLLLEDEFEVINDV